MCMIKLIDLIREVREGARVTFDDKGAATAIDITEKVKLKKLIVLD